MLYVVIKMATLHLFLYIDKAQCHLKDMGEVSTNNWTKILQVVESRIVGGKSANLTQLPFLVQFYNFGGLCGGTILSSKIVLTAAHCFTHNKNLAEMKIFSRGDSLFSIRPIVISTNGRSLLDIGLLQGFPKDAHLGCRHPAALLNFFYVVSPPRGDLYTCAGARFTFDFKAEVHEVWNYVLHEHYNEKFIFSNDIAMIIIRDMFNYGPQVQKAAIVDTNVWMKETEDFIAAGWGEKKYGTGIQKIGLQMIHLQYVSREKCMAENKFEMGPDVFCLDGQGERDTCRGDSGGGVLWKGVIVGIVSHGRNCAQFPGIYINVLFFKSWISQAVKQLYKAFCSFHKNIV